MNIFSKMDNLVSLTENEKILVSYIKENPEAFVKMTSAEISEASFISNATIYRLCKKLDLAGLSELKILVSASVGDYLKERKTLDFNYPIHPNETQYQITRTMQELYEQTVVSSLNNLDLEQLRQAASLMKKVPSIDLYTSAGNLFFAENFKFQMQEIGRFINVPIEEYHQRLTAASSDPSHLSIVVSYGGRGRVIPDIVNILKDNHSPLLLISSTEAIPFAKDATHHLYLSSNESHYNKVSSFSTRLSLLFVLDCLYTSYFKLDYERNVALKMDYYKKLSGLNL
nr:MurR/RpiR family transcriptional regulator [uncultured Trichococcus sp.]